MTSCLYIAAGQPLARDPESIGDHCSSNVYYRDSSFHRDSIGMAHIQASSWSDHLPVRPGRSGHTLCVSIHCMIELLWRQHPPDSLTPAKRLFACCTMLNLPIFIVTEQLSVTSPSIKRCPLPTVLISTTKHFQSSRLV